MPDERGARDAGNGMRSQGKRSFTSRVPRPASQTPDDTDRLNRAIDRLVAGGPQSVLSDPELDELLQLAGHLQHELPPDLPDPAFRESLKAQLSGSRTHLRAVPRRAPRVPYVAAAGAIAAVLVAAIAVGSLALWGSGNDAFDDGTSVLGHLTNEAVPSASAATRTVAMRTPVVVLTNAAPLFTATAVAATDVTPATTTSQAPPTQSTAATSATAATLVTAAPSSTLSTTVSDEDTPTPPQSTPTTAPTAPSATAGLAQEDLPTVDPSHVLSQTAASGMSDHASNDLVLALDADMPDFDQTATVYYLAPPLAEPVAFITNVAQALGISGDVSDGTNAYGRRELWYGTADGPKFRWEPQAGAFTFDNLASQTDSSATAKTLTADQAIQTALDWLTHVGYPAGQVANSAAAVIQNDQWVVNLPDASLPAVGYDVPVGVSVVVNGDSIVTYTQGYWLLLTHVEDAPLVNGNEAWQRIETRRGLWIDGGQTMNGGEFHVDTINFTYILTLDPNTNELVLQPAIKAEGDYTGPNGLDTNRIAVIVPATKGGR